MKEVSPAFMRGECQPYDLVLTDLFITRPPIHTDAAERLQRSCQATPIGIVTAWPVNPDKAKRDGFAFVLPKPFDMDVLLGEVAALLNAPFKTEQQQQQARIS